MNVGKDNYGQFGYGDSEDRGDGPNEMGVYLPEIEFGDNFIPKNVAMGGWHNCVLSKENKVKCWGANFDGQLGYGDSEWRGDEPNEMGNNLDVVDLGDNFDVVQITAGYLFSCALSNGGYVKCWGIGDVGQLGTENSNYLGDNDGEMGNNLTRIDLGINYTVTKISAGGHHICSLSRQGSIKCWGRNYRGQLGYGDTNDRGNSNGSMGDNLMEVPLGKDFMAKDIFAGAHIIVRYL